MDFAARSARVAAGLYKGTVLIKDVETGSLWNHVTGDALSGVLEGGALERIALAHCEWHEWLEMHPDSLVLWGDQRLRKGFGAHHLPGDPAIGAKLRKSLVNPIDERLRHNALVLAVLANGAAAAFPLEQLGKSGPVLHATVGDEAIVVFHQPGTLHTLAYSAVLDDERLEFELGALGRVVDTQTGSHWNCAGECTAGPLRGKKLRYVNSGF